ncbi:hypothetical protein [Streptomyces sp. NPDC056304]
MGTDHDEPDPAAAPQTETGWVYRIGLVLWQAQSPDHPVPGEYRA